MEDLQTKFDAVAEKLQAQIKKSVEETGEAMKISLKDELVKEGFSKEDAANLIATNKEAFEAMLKEVNKRVDTIEINAQKNGKPHTAASFSEELYKGLESNIENLKQLKAGNKLDAKNFEFDFVVKAPGTMTGSGNISGGNVPVEDRLPGLNIIPVRRPRLLDVMSPRSTSSNIVSWTYQANKDGSAAQTAEGSAKNQIDFDIVVASQSLKKTTAYIKVSTEMLDDIEWIQSEIQGELTRELLKAVESQVYSGDDTGQNLNGVRTTATAFAAGTLAGTVDEANIVDVINAALTQIKKAEQELDRPVILMHPDDVYQLKSLKVSSSDRRYVDMVYMAGDSMSISGVPIIETTLVTTDEYLVGDFSRALLVQKGGIRVEVGLDGSDFTNNVRTILAEWRGLVIVKNNDRTAFIKGDFTTDKAALETT